MLVVVDDEDARMATHRGRPIRHPEAINFMAAWPRAICLALSPERCDQLHLPLVSP
jgi:3,4-dihydroxy-2-butanone 4-phosphate synthase